MYEYEVFNVWQYNHFNKRMIRALKKSLMQER